MTYYASGSKVRDILVADGQFLQRPHIEELWRLDLPEHLKERRGRWS
jgi:hypothetical protein